MSAFVSLVNPVVTEKLNAFFCLFVCFLRR